MKTHWNKPTEKRRRRTVPCPHEDGSWRILDYKTDRMLPADHGSREAFRARLEQQYGSQLEIYKAVLQELTGKPVREAMLLSV